MNTSNELDDTRHLIDQLKAEVLPALFENPKTLGEYGSGESQANALDSFSDLITP